LDLAYKPYAEIVNLMVHPDYRGQGIGKRLIEECVKIAEDKGFYIQYLMTDVSNFIAHKLYHKYGFIPAILPQKIVKGRDMWLFRFSRKTFVIEYLDTHPFTNYNVSKKRVRYMDMKVYRIGWNDVLSQDHLYLYFKGQPGQPTGKGTMPRITGVKIFQKNLGLALSIHETSDSIDDTDYSVFLLEIVNIGKKRIILNKVMPSALSGVDVKGDLDEDIIKLDPNENTIVSFKCKLTENFDVLPLSFNTIVITIHVYAKGFLEHPILLSAGFERSDIE